MAQAWSVLARNYAKYGTPLRPNDETLAAVRGLVTAEDPLVVVLGGTPIFAGLARRVWFVDTEEGALRLVEPGSQQRTIQKNWFEASAELSQADLIVGDGAINALESVDDAKRLLKFLAASLQAGAALALRVFLRHELPADAFHERFTGALAGKRFSEARFLVYGVVTDADGVTPVAEVDRYIVRHAPDAYKAEYFAWRGLSPSEAVAVTAKAYFPPRRRFEALLAAAGLRTSTLSAGNFPLAEFTPIYVARG